MSAIENVSESENERGEAEPTEAVASSETDIEEELPTEELPTEELLTSEVGPSRKRVFDRIKVRVFHKKKQAENRQDVPDTSVVGLIKLMQNCFFTKEAAHEWVDALRDTQLSAEGFENLVKADILGVLSHWEQERGKGLEWLCRSDDEKIDSIRLTNRRFILLIYPFIARKHQYIRFNETESFMRYSKMEAKEVSVKNALAIGRVAGNRKEAEKTSIRNYYRNLYQKRDEFKNLRIDININPESMSSESPDDKKDFFGPLCNLVFSFISQYWFEKEASIEDYCENFTYCTATGRNKTIIVPSYMEKFLSNSDSRPFWTEYEKVMYVLFSNKDPEEERSIEDG